MRLNAKYILKTLLLITLTVSCRGQGAARIAEFSDPARALPASITVASWNAQKGTNPRFAADLKLLIERAKPDILFLQEASPDLFEPRQMGGYFAESWSYPWPGTKGVGVMTLSRVPPVRFEPVPTRYREFGVTSPKVSLVTEYPLARGPSLLAVNVHLLNFEVWSLSNLRHQLEGLKAVMARHSGPIILAGDFNTWSRERLELVRKITRDVKLKEVSEFPEGRTAGDTLSEFWNDILGVEKSLPLDRVFILGFKPTAARVLNYDSSDHRPILVKLQLDP